MTRTSRLPLILALVLTLIPVGAAEVACPTCAGARETHGWCDACGLGFVADVAIRSRQLWHTLDAHGHRLNLDNLGCEACVAAAQNDGYCAESKIGFVNGEAYFSRLTWLLARSGRQELADLRCPVCRENHVLAGWCEGCGIGRVGRYTLSSRADFDALVHDLEILVRANDASARCEACAVAIVTDTQCPFCRIRYVDGEPVPP